MENQRTRNAHQQDSLHPAPQALTGTRNCWYRQDWVKRSCDLFLSVIAVVLLSPLFLLGSFLAKLQSTGPVFYRAKRVGKGETIFEMYKFRTMVINADKLGSGLTTHKDSRVTPIGRFLRVTKLDELPNLINVLKGEMSLIGPRPEAPNYVQYYTESQKQVLQVKPGITGPSQIANRNEEEKLKAQVNPEDYYIMELMPKKLALDLHYVATQSFLSDIGWLIKTFWVVIFPAKAQQVENRLSKSEPPAERT